MFNNAGDQMIALPAPAALSCVDDLSARTTLRRELLDRTLIINQAHLRTVLTQYATHYNNARPHQGIGQHVPAEDPNRPTAKVVDLETARIRRKPVLGGLTSEYQIAA